MAKGLTKRQEMILRYIQEYVEREGYPPSIREIGRDFNIGSLRGVTVHLDALERKGFISRANTPRSIKLTHHEYQSNTDVRHVPLVGSIAAGVPITATEHTEAIIPVPSEMVRGTPDPFALRVRGDSMINDGILPDDIVIIRPQSTANHGDLVAAMLGDEATVKRIHFTPSGVKLMPANPSYNPIPVDREDARIVGRVIGLIRDYA